LLTAEHEDEHGVRVRARALRGRKTCTPYRGRSRARQDVLVLVLGVHVHVLGPTCSFSSSAAAPRDPELASRSVIVDAAGLPASLFRDPPLAREGKPPGTPGFRAAWGKAEDAAHGNLPGSSHPLASLASWRFTPSRRLQGGGLPKFCVGRGLLTRMGRGDGVPRAMRGRGEGAHRGRTPAELRRVGTSRAIPPLWPSRSSTGREPQRQSFERQPPSQKPQPLCPKPQSLFPKPQPLCPKPQPLCPKRQRLCPKEEPFFSNAQPLFFQR
jgi:hypothetical protein